MSDAGKTCDSLLVIPAYEEHLRLPPFLRELAGELAQTSFVTHIQIVDDGSSEESLRALDSAVRQVADSPTVQVLPLLRLGQRCGKGRAIRTGWESGKDTPWLAFVDADGAVSALDVRRLLEHSLMHPFPICCVAVRKSGSDRSLHRGWSGRFFKLFVNWLFHSSFQDPQCGFKIISAEAWQKVRSSCRENGFCFDLELLLLLQEERVKIEEIPIDWQEKSGSHFHVLPDGFETLLATIRIRLAKTFTD